MTKIPKEPEFMPQPLSRVKPGIGYSGVIGKTPLAACPPELSILVAECIATWSEVEGVQLQLFTILMGGSKSLAANIYVNLATSSAKATALDQAINTVPHDWLKNLLLTINQTITSYKGERDKLAHHNWHYHPSLPDALLLEDPRLHALGITDDSQRFVYRKKDLMGIRDKFILLTEIGGCLAMQFANYSFETIHTSTELKQVYDRIGKLPDIQQRLNRLNNNSVSPKKAS